jgi:hypothetical protein
LTGSSSHRQAPWFKIGRFSVWSWAKRLVTIPESNAGNQSESAGGTWQAALQRLLAIEPRNHPTANHARACAAAWTSAY